MKCEGRKPKTVEGEKAQERWCGGRKEEKVEEKYLYLPAADDIGWPTDRQVRAGQKDGRPAARGGRSARKGVGGGGGGSGGAGNGHRPRQDGKHAINIAPLTTFKLLITIGRV